MGIIKHFETAGEGLYGAYEGTQPDEAFRPIEFPLPVLPLERIVPPYFIPHDIVIQVPIFKQMVNKQQIDIEGELWIDGQFFMEV